MGRWAVIADDLTGAADAAARIAPWPHGSARVIVAHDETLAPSSWLGEHVTSINTDSRYLAAADANLAVQRAVDDAARHGHRHFYKKIDSLMRGNVGAEISAVLDARDRHFGAGFALIAPSFPEMGRTVRNGILRIDDGARAGADIRSILAFGGLEAAVITVSSKPGSLVESITQVKQAGFRAAVVDAESDADLDFIVQETRGGLDELMLAGSAGLAGHLAPHLTHGATSNDPLEEVQGQSLRALIVIGSYAATARAQRDHLARAGMAVVELDGARSDTPAASARVAEVLADGGSVVITPPRAGTLDLARAHEIADGLGALVAHNAHSSDLLVLTGGETAAAVLKRMGVPAFDVIGELMPGVIASRMLDRDQILVTKSGSFGAPDVLSEVIRLAHSLGRRR